MKPALKVEDVEDEEMTVPKIIVAPETDSMALTVPVQNLMPRRSVSLSNL